MMLTFLIFSWVAAAYLPAVVCIKSPKSPKSKKWGVGLKSTMDNMDGHPSSSIGLEGVWMVSHGSSGGPWMVVWTV